MKRLIYSLFVIIILIQVVNSSNICTAETDEIVLKCKIDDKIFLQDFTCLNQDCSDKLINKNSYQELYLNNKNTNQIILINSIPILAFKNNYEYINKICSEKLNQETITKIKTELTDYEKNKWKYFSGEKIIIQPYSIETEEKLKNEMEIEKEKLEKCYKEEYNNYNGWIFQTRYKQPYCELVFDNENTCFTTRLSISKFIFFFIFNPTKITLTYFFSTLILLFVIISNSYFIYKLIKENKFEKFIRITRKKIIYFSIMLIPLIYILGLFIGYLVNQRFYIFVNKFYEIIIQVILCILLYYLSCIIIYVQNKKD